MAEDEGRLQRWHRRKTAARATPAIDAAEPSQDLPVPEEPVSETEATEPPPDLPDIDSLDADSDFSVFMADGVPEEIKRLALRKLWRLDPVLANVDGLVDYGEDFTDSALVVEGMKTAYRIGKGLLTDEEEKADEGAAVAAEETDREALEQPEDPDSIPAPDEGGEEYREEGPLVRKIGASDDDSGRA